MKLLDDTPGSASRNWMVSGVIWMFVGTSLGLIAATELAVPDFLGGHRYLEFGRIRPLHVNTVWFGFLSMVLIGAGLHYVPQMLKTSLASERWANAAMWLWNLAQLTGMACVITGYTSAHEYAEYPLPADLMGLFSLLILVIVVFITLTRRREPLIYVAVWYYAASLLWFTSSWAFLGGVGWWTGLVDAIYAWFYGHQVFGLWITTLSTGAAYYVIPREARHPLFSHTLSLIGFWMIVTCYTPVGTHHLLQAPIPAWQKVLAITQSMLLLIPVYAFLTNVWMTVRGRLGRIEESLTLRYVITGTIFYWIVSTQGSIQALISVQRLTHFTQWVPGHAHTGLLGFAGFIAAGVMYDVLPQILHRPIYSARLANFQYWCMLIGQTGFMVILTIAGLIQGSAWLNGETEYRVIPELHLYMLGRAFIGTFVVMGAYVQFWNVMMTLWNRKGEREPLEPVIGYSDEELIRMNGGVVRNGHGES